MARKSPELMVEEVGGNKYPDLQAAQRNALPTVTSFCTDTLRRLLANGSLIIENGQIIRYPERKQI